MKEKISNRDWETLSAYLDGQLPPQKQARLEARLQQEPDLFVALAELKDTRHVLRNAPRLRAPRNFSLTHQMVGQKARSPRLAPVFGWASAVASLLLVLVFVGDIFSAGGVVPVPIKGSADQAAYVDSQADVMPETVEMGMPEESEMEESVSAGGSENVGDMKVPEDELAPTDGAEPVEVPAPPTHELEIAMAEEPTEEAASEPSMDSARSAETEDATIFAAPPEDTGDNIVATDIEVDADALVLSSSLVITEAFTTVAVTEELEQVQTDETMAKSGRDLEEEPAPEWQSQGDSETREPHPTQAMALAITEQVPQEVYAVTKSNDYILGVEVILAMFILACGIAWIYLRYRGG